MNAITMNSATGFRGKLPTHGDFVQRHVANDFALAWDHWLEQALHAAQVELGARWQAAYAATPFWRFAFAAGVCGETSCIGVMAPSVDRVGREFPLAVVRRIDCEPLQAACGDPTWFAAVEAALATARQGGYASIDDFDEALQAIATPLPLAVKEPYAPGDSELRGSHGLAAWAGAI
ncbi:MAG: type VI secretion system-associated protein TagF, partial [Solimonas sp.]